MATYTYTFTFDSDLEGWDANYTDYTSWNSVDGGVIYNEMGGGPGGTIAVYWTGTWEDLGVTPGETVESVEASLDYRYYSTDYGEVSLQWVYGLTLYTSVSYSSSDYILINAVSPSANYPWNTLSGSSQDISSDTNYNSSDSVIYLNLPIAQGGTSPKYSGVDYGLFDNIELTITTDGAGGGGGSTRRLITS